jgi:protein MPE1
MRQANREKLRAIYLEYKEDGHILPRSSSVLIVRRPAAKPGKGKASYYANGGGLGAPSAEAGKGSGTGPGANTWHKGAMSKRFDGMKEDQNSAKPAPVRQALLPTGL